jgi:hypothetical protein
LCPGDQHTIPRGINIIEEVVNRVLGNAIPADLEIGRAHV